MREERQEDRVKGEKMQEKGTKVIKNVCHDTVKMTRQTRRKAGVRTCEMLMSTAALCISAVRILLKIQIIWVY